MSDHLRFVRRLSYLVLGVPFLLSICLGAFLYFHPGYRNTEELVRELTGPHSDGMAVIETLSNYGAVISFLIFLLFFGIMWFRNR